jgi:hypothetical protein
MAGKAVPQLIGEYKIMQAHIILFFKVIQTAPIAKTVHRRKTAFTTSFKVCTLPSGQLTEMTNLKLFLLLLLVPVISLELSFRKDEIINKRTHRSGRNHVVNAIR